MSKTTVNILMLTVFVIVIWLATELYFLSKKDLSLELDKKLTPEKTETFDPALDRKTIEVLKQNQTESQTTADLPTPTPTPTPPFLRSSTRSAPTL